MVYKNNEIKNLKIQYRKLIFSLVLLIYFIGLCAGCSFAFKNSRNLAFVQKVTVIENIANTENTALFALSGRYLARDLIMLSMILVFKYAGILKGLCVTVPFIMAVQNSCIYISKIYLENLSFFNLFFYFFIKDTAVIFIILVYNYTVVNEIINHKSFVKSDIKKLMIYSVAIILIYIIDTVIKTMLNYM